MLSNTSNNGLISIVTPTYNSENTISKTVESILAQSYSYFEHIIIDKLSSDKTLDVVRSLYNSYHKVDSLRIISEADNSISEAFNKGINLAKGDVITILNSDDYYLDENLFRDVLTIFKDNDFLFVHSDMYEFDTIYGSIVRFPSGKTMQQGMIYNHPTMFFRKEVYDKFRAFNESYLYAMDFEFLVRLEKSIPNFHEKGKYLKGKPKVFMSYGGNSWKNMFGAKREEIRALKEHSMWTFSARLINSKNVLKIRFKKLLVNIGLSSLVKILRHWKWDHFHPTKNT